MISISRRFLPVALGLSFALLGVAHPAHATFRLSYSINGGAAVTVFDQVAPDTNASAKFLGVSNPGGLEGFITSVTDYPLGGFLGATLTSNVNLKNTTGAAVTIEITVTSDDVPGGGSPNPAGWTIPGSTVNVQNSLSTTLLSSPTTTAEVTSFFDPTAVTPLGLATPTVMLVGLTIAGSVQDEADFAYGGTSFGLSHTIKIVLPVDQQANVTATTITNAALVPEPLTAVSALGGLAVMGLFGLKRRGRRTAV